MIRAYLREIVERTESKKGKTFDYFIQIVILISLVAFAFETLPNNPPAVVEFLHILEIICITIFTVEYVLRIYVAENPFRYIFSFYGIIDLLAILPFYLTLAFDLKALRAFRVFRVFRALKLVRYNKAMQRFKIAANLVKEEIVLFLMVSAIMIFLTASGIYYFEHEAQPETFSSVFHSLWWSIVTLTTVGYGDVYPITLGGRIFTFFVLIIGVGFITVPAGLVASSLSNARKIQNQEDKEDSKVIEE